MNGDIDKMKVMIAPDSFKGTMTAFEVCEIMERAVEAAALKCEVIKMPIADGGEGSIEAFGCEKIYCTVTGPELVEIGSCYGSAGDTAIIEMAACAGLPLMSEGNPETATTYGVGELIKHALDGGYRKFIVGLGGSATNDAGTGMASALGVKFYDDCGKTFIPTGLSLKDVKHIDISSLDERLSRSEIITMCDITNPLYGENGAAYIFAPQKGADPKMVKRLDSGLRHIAEIIRNALNIDVSRIAGGGAAGGTGAGMVAFLGSELKKGIDVVLDANNFDEHLKSCDFIFSGEGKFDSQSLRGKVVSGIAERAKNADIPLIVIAGAVDDASLSDIDLRSHGITAAFSIQRMAQSYENAVKHTEEFLFETTRNVMNILISH